MKILVTGANGYIGSKVIKRLLDENKEVVALDLNNDHVDKRAEFYRADIFSEENIYQKSNKPDVCLHLAWRDGFIHNSLNHIKDFYGHYSFLKNLIDNGMKHVAVMGTMHEIGYWNGIVNDDTPTRPQSLYGIAKNALRESLELYAKKNKVIFQWLRAFYIYGDDDFGNSIFCKIRQAVKDGEKTFPFVATGRNKFDFINVEELVSQIVATINQDKINGVINICSGKPVSLSEKVESYIIENNLPITLKYGAYPDREYDSPCIYGDNRKIKAILESK